MSAAVSSILLAPGLAGALVDLARHAAPAEACGFLVGSPLPVAQGRLRVDRLIVATNAAARHDRFRVDPRAFERAQRRARARGDDLLGVFHGHPRSAPIPSEEDLRAVRALGSGIRRIDLVAGRSEPADDGGEAGWILAAWRLGPGGVRRLAWFEEGGRLGAIQSDSAS